MLGCLFCVIQFSNWNFADDNGIVMKFLRNFNDNSNEIIKAVELCRRNS